MKEVERVDTRPVDDGTIDALNRIPNDLAVVKMQTDTIMGVALSRPRDHAKILKDLQMQLTTYRSFAERALYAKPVGKDPATGKQKYATGLSIRAAESIRSAMGFNSVDVAAKRIDDYNAEVQAVFVDMQAGLLTRLTRPVSRRYTTAKKVAAVWDEDRFNNVVLKAEMSKALRDVVLRTIPPGLRFELEEAVDRALDEFLDDATQKKIVAQFTQYQVTQEMLEARIGKGISSFTKEDRKMLVGMYTAIKTGEGTVDEMFGDVSGTAETVQTPTKLKDKLAASRPKVPETVIGPVAGAVVQAEPVQSPPETSKAELPPFNLTDPGTWFTADDGQAGCNVIYQSIKLDKRADALKAAGVEFPRDINKIADVEKLCEIGSKLLEYYTAK